MRISLLLALIFTTIAGSLVIADESEPFTFHTRKRAKLEDGSIATVAQTTKWDPKKTAVVVCDMWDKHWCDNATRRVGEMAPRMNEAIKAARARGALIIHCPSDTMDFYKDTPQRKRAMDAPVVETKVPLERWCRIMPDYEGALPVDDSDGGCDPEQKNYKAWSRQIAAIEIFDEDAITDSPEAFYLMKQHGIENVLVMGVHTNMCVLGRPFSIRQMVRQGQNVLLVRDLTDSMYNPAKAPQTTHVRGTELIVEHIERWWCPTVQSTDLTGVAPNRFTDDHRKHAVIICNDSLYHQDQLLTSFADTLQRDHNMAVTFVYGEPQKGFEGMEALRTADVAILFARRQPLTELQQKEVESYLASGKPLVAMRTASHAFSLRGDAPAGLKNWNEFDKTILGGSYRDHGSGGSEIVAPKDASSPLLARVSGFPWKSKSDLYNVKPLAEDATVLIAGRDASGAEEPVAWTRQVGKSKVFYTSLGGEDDFKNSDFRKLLSNAVEWAVQP